jgi:hypothetical protein
MQQQSPGEDASLPLWHKADVLKASPDVRFRGDIVAKVENRTTPKISRKLIFGLLAGCIAL